jgi:hypothetical protein
LIKQLKKLGLCKNGHNCKKLLLCRNGHSCKDPAGERRISTSTEVARLRNGCSSVFRTPTKYDSDVVAVCRLLASL